MTLLYHKGKNTATPRYIFNEFQYQYCIPPSHLEELSKVSHWLWTNKNRIVGSPSTVKPNVKIQK